MRACHDRRADLSKRAGHRQHALGRPGWLAGRRRGIEQSHGNGVTPALLLALCTVALSLCPLHPCLCASDIGLPLLNACMIRDTTARGRGSVCGVHGHGFLCTARLRCVRQRHAPCMRTYEPCLHLQVVTKARREVFVSVWLELAPGAPSWQTLPFHLWLYCGMPVSPLIPR